MAEVKFEANKISLDGGETWTDIKPSKYENWLQESIHATGGHGYTDIVAVCDIFHDDVIK